MIGQAIDAYEARYETKWQEAPPHCQKMWLDAWGKAMEKAISVVETYRVSVGNSAAGEMAAEWTMENLREVRDELREMVPNAPHEGPGAASSRTVPLDAVVGGLTRET